MLLESDGKVPTGYYVVIPVTCRHDSVGHQVKLSPADARALADVLRKAADEADRLNGVEPPMAKVLKLVR